MEAPRLEAQKQWIRYQAEQQYEKEKHKEIEDKQREEINRGR